MNKENEKQNFLGGLVGGVIIILLGYGWLSFFDQVSGDTRWLVDLVGWGLYVVGTLVIISSFVQLMKK